MARFIQVDFFCPDGNVRCLREFADVRCGADLGKSVRETVQMLTEAYGTEAVKIVSLTEIWEC